MTGPPPTQPKRRGRRRKPGAKQVSICAAGFPHIVDAIFDYACLATLLRIGGLCKEWRLRVTHRAAYLLTLSDDGVVAARSGLVSTGSFTFPPPLFYKCFTDPWPFIKYTQVLDYGGKSTRINALLMAWKCRIDTMRVLPSCKLDAGDCNQSAEWPHRLVYFDYRASVGEVCNVRRLGAKRLVVHISAPSRYTQSHGHVMYAQELVVFIQPWERTAPLDLDASLERVMQSQLADLVYLVHVGREERCVVQVVGLERLDSAVLGLRTERAERAVRRWLRRKYPPYGPAASAWLQRYSLTFRRVEEYRDHVGETVFEIETQQEIRDRPKKVSTCFVL